MKIYKRPPIEGRTFILSSMHYPFRDIKTVYINSLRWCIAQKSNKIKLYKSNYSEWQLLLVDTMRWDLGTDEVEDIKARITDLGLFNKIIVIDYESNLIFKLPDFDPSE